MESSLPVFAGTNVASAPLDGRLAAVLAAGAPAGSTDGNAAVEAVDERDSAEETEFWDACWTLEDEWIPRAVVRPEPPVRPVHKVIVPTGLALL
jgi:hypothetical protein